MLVEKLRDRCHRPRPKINSQSNARAWRASDSATCIIGATAKKKKKIGSSNLLGGLKGVKFHGEFNYASLMTLKWCVFKRTQKNCFFRPKTAIFGQKIGSSNLLRGLRRVKFHGESNYASPMALKWCVFKRSQKKRFFRPKTAIFGQKMNHGPT